MNDALRIILPVFLGLVVLLTLMRGFFGLVRRRLQEVVRRKFAGQLVVRESIGANFFGQSSKGMGQVRGNGALVLTQKELYFVMFAPRREMSIPLETITSVSTPRSHLGKSCVAKLLRVDFCTNDGEDSVAWAVRELDEWVSAIKRYKPHKSPV